MVYTQSVFSSPRFIPSLYFIPSPQSVVRSPCFILTGYPGYQRFFLVCNGELRFVGPPGKLKRLLEYMFFFWRTTQLRLDLQCSSISVIVQLRNDPTMPYEGKKKNVTSQLQIQLSFTFFVGINTDSCFKNRYSSQRKSLRSYMNRERSYVAFGWLLVVKFESKIFKYSKLNGHSSSSYLTFLTLA